MSKNTEKKTKPTGKFKCCQCSFEFESAKYTTACTLCGHKYVKFSNYKKLRKSNPELFQPTNESDTE